ncbi:MAG: DNA polymerase/3'-5' exonuclease PolX [Anaerolineae bacterium]|nr:MAG: DNA polymerase/3'-5' exonuclease PolX [Anaerolineae bacterium]
MTNKELADTFTLIANLLEIKGEVIYKILAYRKAAETLSAHPRAAKDIWQEAGIKGLKEISGVGPAIADKIDELLNTGKLDFLEKLKAEVPESLAGLLQVPDLGPKKVKMFYEQLGVASIEQLKAAAEGGKLAELPGMGKKSEEKILVGIESLSRRSGRTPLGDALPFAGQQIALLKKVKGVKAVEAAGSLRRRRDTVGDLDILVAAEDSEPVMEAFTSQPLVARVLGKGKTKSSVEFNNGMRAQVWVHPPARFGTAIQYATGSKDHNVRLREIALDQGYSLSEHALTKEDGSEILCAKEEEVYKTLGLPWIPPELREDRGEVKAAQSGNLPKLIAEKDIIADLHSHTTWSDGKLSILEMAEAAIARGRKTLAITDHSHNLGIANGLSVERLKEQRKEITAARKKLGDRILLLHGIEMEIRADGTLDFDDETLAWLDIVIASLHVGMRQPREKNTLRILNAINNPHVDIIAHPTNRLLPDRLGSDLDMEAIFAAALANGTVLEINSNPSRLDLDDVHARLAAELGIPITINTDAHAAEHFDFLSYGVATARRAWLTKGQVVNTWKPEKIQAWLKKRG